MTVTATFFIVFVSMWAFMGLFGAIVMWTSHISMTKKFTQKYGYATFSEFIYQFNKVADWQFRDYDKISIESGSDKEGTYFRNDIISFEGDGMVLGNPFSYLLALLSLKRKRKELEHSSRLVPLRWKNTRVGKDG